jgi:hypothetical protein
MTADSARTQNVTRTHRYSFRRPAAALYGIAVLGFSCFLGIEPRRRQNANPPHAFQKLARSRATPSAPPAIISLPLRKGH